LDLSVAGCKVRKFARAEARKAKVQKSRATGDRKIERPEAVKSKGSHSAGLLIAVLPPAFLRFNDA